MPAAMNNPEMIAVVGVGFIGAALAVVGVFLLAVRWRNRTAVPYCLSIFVFYSLLYIATFKQGLVNAGINPDIGDGVLLTVQFVGQALVTALGVSVFALLLFAAYLGLMGRAEFPVKRTTAYTGCALFCVVFTVFLNPTNAVRQDNDPADTSIYVRAMTSPSPASIAAAKRKAQRTLAELRQIGALARVEANENLLVHHVRGQFLDLPNEVVEEYLRAALFHHIHFDGGTVKPVLLRVADSERDIALLDEKGRFRRNRTFAAQLGQIRAGS